MNIVSFGGGTNSAALLIGLYKHKIPIDLITFADTGAEHPHTYQFIEIINQWLADTIDEVRRRRDLDKKVVFLNAWNEWGEGAYLEPDSLWGYAYLDATLRAIMQDGPNE